MPSDHIYQLIISNLSGDITPEGERELARWLSQDPDNMKEYGSIAALWYGVKLGTETAADNSAKAPKTISARRPRRKKRFIAAVSAAAVLAAVAMWQFIVYENGKPPFPAGAVQPKITLVLSNGSEVVLDNDIQTEIADHGASIHIDSATLAYTADAASEQMQEISNKIIVPKSGQYSVRLSDGTIVKLNSESTLSYPVNFSDTIRRVALTGEACFYVSADAARPFVVEGGNACVTVLGTVFNMSAYPDETRTTVTLVSGLVEVGSGGRRELLHPDQQVSIYQADGTWEKNQVDAHIYTEWTEGVFRFESMPLEEVMRRLSRWFDIECVFNDPSLGSIPFTGGFRRHDDVMNILNMIGEVKNINFSIRKGVVIIDRKKG